MYLPYEERTPDTQYRDVLRAILETGQRGPTRQGVDVLTSLNHTMKFELANGFPLITERSIKGFWRKPIAELLTFFQGAHTQPEFDAGGFGNFWSQWTSKVKTAKRGLPDLDIGPHGSYGPAFTRFPTPDGGAFDQIENLILTLIDHPDDRRGWVTNWVPDQVARNRNYEPKVTIAPCHGTMYARVLGGKLTLTMMQRSADTPVGVPSNMVQYAAFTLILGQLTGLEVEAYHHHLVDAHIYEPQIEFVEEMLTREPRRLPTVVLTDEGRTLTRLTDFTPDHFELSDYEPHPSIAGIPVAT